MAGSPVPIDRVPVLTPDARIDILDVNIDVNVAVRCRCLQTPAFLVSGHVPGKCPACQTVYVIRALQIQKPQDGPTEVAVIVGPKEGSRIVAPGGPGHGSRD
jgi:hypothetical protein